jgi:hypothetical protein
MKLSHKELTILWSLGLAFLMIAAAIVFKGTSAYNWIEYGLTGMAVATVLRSRRSVCQR